jgi:putative endopeptidase
MHLFSSTRVLLLATMFSLCLSATSVADDLHSGLDLDGFDSSVRPQDDLFLHVNGRWILHTQIPGDKSNYGSFIALDDAARKNILAIIEEAAENGEAEIAQKVGDFYHSFMDAERIESLGGQPIAPLLKTINNIDTAESLVTEFGSFQAAGLGSPIGFFVTTDAKDSSRYLSVVGQSGTTLPDRDYYLKDDSRFKAARDALKVYVIRLFELAELDGGEAAATAILDLETRLAKIQWTRTELRDAEKRYNLFPTAQLASVSDRIDWSTFFKAVGTPDIAEVNVATPSFFTGLGKLIDDVPLDVWKQYLRFRVLDAAAPYLSSDFAQASFDLHKKAIAGVPEMQPRWKRAVEATSGAGAGSFGVLGDAVGQLYVQRHFPKVAKDRMDQLVANLLKSYESSIDDLAWMTETTREQALEKLHAITPKIGYTTKWRDYSGLVISPDDLIGNMQRSLTFEHQRMINKLGKPVDKTEWGMTPQTVNAYYNPGKNEIVFPAAILQPPFFDATAEDAVNYGGIGAVIGHEISHGFDDQGSKYDADGNLKNWWTEDDRVAFDKLTGALVAQFSSYEAMPGKTVNGKLTLGENIADLSGMAIALKAYHLSLGDRRGEEMDGYSPDQRFFLGWAQIWRRKYREEELIRRLVTDPHSPSAFRANGPVSNLEAFYKAFDLKTGDELFRPKPERIQIW